jgi:Protein of unknown function (DUF3224)
MMQSTATFENTKHEPVPLGEGNGSIARSKVKAQRKYKGALAGESEGDLLVCQTSETAFGYVGMDLFKGSLDGRAGTFIFQHGELHADGKVSPFGFIVTGSGTDALKGIEGTVSISVSPDWVHTITLNWEIANAAA